jgi:methylmalonyl-CoA mutase N-terminal domain/subunit
VGQDHARALPREEPAFAGAQVPLPDRQQVVAYESGVADIVDPLGGSYAIEALTERIEKGAEDYIARIDAMGGMVSAIEQGFVQREIQNTAYEYQLQIERKERVIVGLNAFATKQHEPVPVGKVDPRLEEEQVARLRAVRSKRDATKHAEALQHLENAAKSTANVMPPILEAVKARATVGEIADVLRAVFGEHQETVTL